MKNFHKLSLALLLILATTLQAQTTKYGIRAGVSIPDLKTKDDNIYSKDYESVTGFDVSIFGDFGISEKFSIKAEVGFIRKGGERNGIQPIPAALLGELSNLLQPGQAIWADFENEAVFSYIEIPVLAKYQWSLSDSWGLYINAGPYLDFMLNPEQVTSGESSFYFDETKMAPVQIPVNPQDPPQNWIFIDLPPQDLTAKTDISDDLATVDVGIMWGLGLTRSLKNQNELFFDVRGSYGFIPLQKDEATYGKVHMGNLSFSLGYAFNIAKKSKQTPTN